MKLIQTLFRTLLVIAVVLVTACGKENASFTEVEGESVENSDEAPYGKLVSYELKSSLPAAEQVGLLLDSMSIDAPICFDIDLSEYGLELKAYRITYNTVDILGNTIVLSGDVCYIDGGLSSCRLLGSVSLFHPAFATTENFCCDYEQYAFIGRSIYNALVVYPHYQGFYAGKQYRVTVSESLLKARQAIDCELAALELVKKLDGVEMLPWYVTDNMGISNGTSATLATHYLLEQDPELKKVNKKSIRLYGTYCCEGPYKYSQLMTYLADEFPYEDLQDVEDFSQVALISILVGTYDTWKGQKDADGNVFFDGIEDVKEYFNPDLFTRKDLTEYGYVVSDVVKYFRDGKLDHHTRMFKRVGLSSREMINPAFFKEDGKFDEDNALVKALYAAFAQNEVMTEGWNPKNPLTFSHSIADELCPFEQTHQVYLSLSKYGLNPNVHFYTIGQLGHEEANQFFGIRDLFLRRHPSGN